MDHREGEGEFIQNGNFMRVSAGNVLHIPMKTLHSIRALTPMEIIVVQTGIGQERNQLIELYQTWNEMAENCIKV